MVRSANERSLTFYLGCALWITGGAWLVAKGFGVVVFAATVLMCLWKFGLRERFASEEEYSAYNVFNPGGSEVLGGFTGRQLDRQLRGDRMAREENDVRGSSGGHEVAPLVTIQRTTPTKISDKERVRRRQAAAAAAELRLGQEQRC